MKIFINKKNFLKKFVLDKNLTESEAIIYAAQNFYRPYCKTVQIEENLIAIDLSNSITSHLIQNNFKTSESINQEALITAIPLLEKLVREDVKNKFMIDKLYEAYDLRGDFEIILAGLFK